MMKDKFSAWENAWSAEQKKISKAKPTFADMQQAIKQRKSESLIFQYGTLAILILTLLALSAFFIYVAPVQRILSRIGVTAMLGGLTIRVILEIISVIKLKKISHLSSSKANTNSSISFHAFRVRTQSWYSPFIVGVFTIGYYMITPEFLAHLPAKLVLLFDLSYVFMAIILIYFIRKGVQKELRNLKEWTELLQELEE